MNNIHISFAWITLWSIQVWWASSCFTDSDRRFNTFSDFAYNAGQPVNTMLAK